MGIVKRRAGGAWVNAVTQKRANGAWTTASATVRAGGAWGQPWIDADIGAPALAGSSSLTAGVYTVKGAGQDIRDTFDQFHFVYQALSGDGTIIARVTSQANTSEWAKTGVMIKQSTAAGSAYVLLAATPLHGINLEFAFNQTVVGPTITPPAWLKLTRLGSTVTGYSSADGQTWTTVGTTTFSGTALVGLFVTSHNASQLNTSVFDNVSVVGSVAPPVPQPVEQPPAGDNTAWLQTRLDALPVGGTLNLGPYTYRHNNVVFIRRDGVTINANGAVFQATAESTSAVKIYANNVTVNGLKLTCPVTTQRWVAEEQHKLVVHGSGHRLTDIAIDGSAGAGLFMWQCSNYTVTRPNIKNTRADTLHQTGGCNNGFVDHPTVQNGGDDGVAVVSYGGEPMCHDITIESPTVIGTTWGRGISVVGGQNITYRNIDLRDTNAAGVYIACEPSYTTLGVTTVKVLGGTITRCNTNGQVVHGGVMIYSGRSGLTISDVVIDGVTIVNTPPQAQRNMAINQSGGGLGGVVFSNIAVQQSGNLPVLQSNSARSAWTASGITVNGTSVTL